MSKLTLAFRLAVRDLRHGLSGFRIFVACLALGVAAIAAVNLVSLAFLQSLSEKGQQLLGGDVEVRLTQRELDDPQRAWLATQGRLSTTAELRGMLRAEKGEERTLVDVKAVDTLYPLFGSVESDPQAPLTSSLERNGSAFGALIEASLMEKLGLKVGDRAILGVATLDIRGVVTEEPDRVAGGFAFGPRVLVSLEALRASGLVQPGSLITWNYRVAFPKTVISRDDTKVWIAGANKQFPDAGWFIRDRWNAAQGARRFIDEVGAFLTLVGLTALVVGGVGVGNAVRSYLDRRQADIATLKCLGASGDFVVGLFLIEVMLIAMLGIGLGLLLGLAIPVVVIAMLGNLLPVPVSYVIDGWSLGQAGLFGFLIALVFALWPLARARDIKPASLFRDLVAPERRWPAWPYLTALAVFATALLALAITTAGNVFLTVAFIGGALLTFAVLRLAAWAVMWIAKTRTKAARTADMRLALSNLYRPGAPTSSVMLSLGLGLALIATIALIDVNLNRRIGSELARQAPTYFFVDIQSAQADAFDRLLKSFKSSENYTRTPMLRGRITKLNGITAADAKISSEVRWALNSDRGITYGAPRGVKGTVVEGAWWEDDYKGPAQVSFDQALARGMNLKVGDSITLNISGRNLDFKIASLRKVDYSNMQMNFSIIVSPGTVEAAPHAHLATVRVAQGDEAALERAVAQQFPNVSLVRTREAIERATGLISQLSDAVRAASGITLITGFLVLGGAIAAGQRQRLYDAVVLKVLGATRRRVMGMYLIEFAMMGFAAGLIAALAGSIAAWAVMTQVLQADFAADPLALISVIAGGMLVTVLLGLANTWSAMGVKPAAVLRTA